MAEPPRDAEISALESLISALEPLDDDARARVLEYTFRRLGMREMSAEPHLPAALPDTPVLPSGSARAGGVVDIRTLRAEKGPGSAIEMAAIVAYYLAEAAPEGERKATVSTADLEKYFKQAGHPLPSRMGNVLPNATSAGYFDSATRGEYKLNPIGFNLVTQNLPRTPSAGQRAAPSRRRTATKPATKSQPPKKRSA